MNTFLVNSKQPSYNSPYILNSLDLHSGGISDCPHGPEEECIGLWVRAPYVLDNWYYKSLHSLLNSPQPL